jgi:hypothetical protein
MECLKEKEHLEDLGCKWENTEMGLTETGLEAVEWIHVAQAATNGRLL